LLIDLHFHTSRYSGCGRSSPEEMLSSAQAAGLQAIFITEHHRRWAADELAELQALFPGVAVYSGLEVTTAEGEDLLIYGVPPEVPFEFGMPAHEAIAQARAYDSFIILAHPYRYNPTVPDEIAVSVDAIEVHSIHILEHAREGAYALAEKHAKLAVAASDAHHHSAVGLYALETVGQQPDEAAIMLALRGGAFSLYSDRTRLAAMNALVLANLDEVKARLAAGEPSEEIASQVAGFNYQLVVALSKGLAFTFPLV